MEKHVTILLLALLIAIVIILPVNASNIEYKILWSYDAGRPVYCVGVSGNGEYVVAITGERLYYFDKNGLKWSMPMKYKPSIHFPLSSLDVRITDNGKVVVKIPYGFYGISYKVIDSNKNILLEYNSDFKDVYTSWFIDLLESLAKIPVALSENGKWLVVPYFDVKTSKNNGLIHGRIEGYLILIDVEKGIEKFRHKFWTTKLTIKEEGRYVVDRSEWVGLGDLTFNVLNNGYVVVCHLLYYPSNPKKELYILDNNGNIIWYKSDLSTTELTESAGNSDFIIVLRSIVYGVNVSNEAILWDYKIGEAKKVVFSSDNSQALVVFPDNTISPRYDKVYLFDKNKRVVWKYKLGYRVYGRITDVRASNDFTRIYITTERGYIICLDKNGQKVWETKLSNFKLPKISKDGKIVSAINSQDPYEVYVFERVEKAKEELKVTPANTPTPRATMTQTPEHGEALHATRTPGFDVILTLATSITALVILKLRRENF